MTINLDTEIVATRYDAAARTCHYTLWRDGKRWTVAVPLDHLEAHGSGAAGDEKRRAHLANMLSQAMQGPHDPEPPTAAAIKNPFVNFGHKS